MSRYLLAQKKRRARSVRRILLKQKRLGIGDRHIHWKRLRATPYLPIYLPRGMETVVRRKTYLKYMPLKTIGIFHSSWTPPGTNVDVRADEKEYCPDSPNQYYRHECACSWMVQEGGQMYSGRPDLRAEWGLGGLAWKALEFLPGPLDYAIRITPNDTKPRTCGDLWRFFVLEMTTTLMGFHPLYLL